MIDCFRINSSFNFDPPDRCRGVDGGEIFVESFKMDLSCAGVKGTLSCGVDRFGSVSNKLKYLRRIKLVTYMAAFT